MADEQAILKDSIVVSHDGHEYEFKIPSVRDRTKIYAVAAKLRKDADPDGMGLAYSYNFMDTAYMESIAQFLVLIKTSSAPWVYTTDKTGKPILDIDKWPSDVPIVEVMEKFADELTKFREGGDKH
jgi:hypothetical protein